LISAFVYHQHAMMTLFLKFANGTRKILDPRKHFLPLMGVAGSLPNAIIAKVGGTLTFTAASAQKPLVF
jgi:hypothetical protein